MTSLFYEFPVRDFFVHVIIVILPQCENCDDVGNIFIFIQTSNALFKKLLKPVNLF